MTPPGSYMGAPPMIYLDGYRASLTADNVRCCLPWTHKPIRANTTWQMLARHISGADTGSRHIIVAALMQDDNLSRS